MEPTTDLVFALLKSGTVSTVNNNKKVDKATSRALPVGYYLLQKWGVAWVWGERVTKTVPLQSRVYRPEG